MNKVTPVRMSVFPDGCSSALRCGDYLGFTEYSGEAGRFTFYSSVAVQLDTHSKERIFASLSEYACLIDFGIFLSPIETPCPT